MTVLVTSLGMVSSVGHDVASACASIRAGVTRPADITYFEMVDPESHDNVPIQGHPIAGMTDGFSCLGRWQVMSQRAIADLLAFGGLPDSGELGFWRATALVFVLPVLDHMRFLPASFCRPERMQKRFLRPCLDGTELPIPEENARLMPEGPVATFVAIRDATAIIEQRRAARVIIVATDTLLDRVSLGWLAFERRLKTAETSTGLVPGEAACAFMLEEKDAAAARGAEAVAGIERICTENEPAYPNQGRAMAKALRDLLAYHGGRGKDGYRGDVFVNINGENGRAYEFGSAQTQLPPDVWQDCAVHVPATEIGDTGAASGAVGIVLAARAHQRGYATADQAIVVAASDDGEVGAAYLTRADDP